jgi:hypothetical protein
MHLTPTHLREVSSVALGQLCTESIRIQDCCDRMFSVLCYICHEPMSLIESSTVADERGQTVHEDCYVKQVTTPYAMQEQGS